MRKLLYLILFIPFASFSQNYIKYENGTQDLRELANNKNWKDENNT